MGEEYPERELESWNEKHDIVIEIIDPAERRVVARRRFEQAFLFPVHGNTELLYSPRQTEAGYVFFDIYSATIR